MMADGISKGARPDPAGRRARSAGVALVLLLLSGALAAPVLGQQPDVPAPGAPAAPAAAAPAAFTGPEVNLRLTFVMLDQYSYQLHPYYQITGDAGFRNGKAPSSFFFTIGTRKTDEGANFVNRFLHSLPPFGVEGVMALDVPFPRGFSYGFDYFVFPQEDVDAARGVTTIIPIVADTYLYNLSLRFYFFNPNDPGVNYFVGLGLGILEGKMRAAPFANQDAEIISYSQSPIGTTRMGLESKGDNWGFRYELVLVNADKVGLGKNPYPAGKKKTEIDFSGAIVRLALFHQF
jgi:hypothetical protein